MVLKIRVKIGLGVILCVIRRYYLAILNYKVVVL